MKIRRFRFKTKYLKALQAFMAKQDVRFYLNGFLVKREDNGNGVILVATNGHRLVVIHDDSGYSNGEYIIRPSREFFSIGSRSGKKSDPRTIPDYVESFGNTIAINSEAYQTEFNEQDTFEFTPGILHAEYCESIDGRFPDFNRVIKPNLKPINNPIGLNTNYLEDLKHITPDAGKFPLISMMTSGDKHTVYFKSVSNPEILAAIMPVRDDTTLNSFFPEFLKLKKENSSGNAA